MKRDQNKYIDFFLCEMYLPPKKKYINILYEDEKCILQMEFEVLQREEIQ